MKIAARILVGLLLLLSLMLAAVTVLLTNEFGRVWLVNRAVALAHQSGFDIQITDLHSRSLGQWSLSRLVVQRDQQILIDAEAVELVWQPTELLQKQLHVTKLLAKSVSYYQPENKKSKTTPNSMLALPTSPFTVEVDQLDLLEVTVHGVKLPQAQTLPTYKVHGSASAFTEAAPLYIALNIESVSNPADGLKIQTEIADPSSVRIRGKLAESPGGLVGTIARMPPQQAIDLNFEVLVQKDFDQYNYLIKQFQLPLMGHQFDAKGTLHYKPSAKELYVKQLALTSDQHRHRLEGVINPEDFWFDAQLEQLPLDILSPWFPELESGELTGHVHLNWLHRYTNPLPEIETESSLALVYRQQHLTAKLDGELKDGLITFAPSSIQQQNAKVDVEGKLDLTGERSDLKAVLHQFSSDLLLPWTNIVPADLQVTTDLAALTLVGSWKNPRVTMRGAIAGQYRNEPFKADLVGSGSRKQAQFEKLTLIAQGSEIRGKGLLDWSGKNTNVELDFSQIKPKLFDLLPETWKTVLPPGLSFIVNGHAQIQGPLTAPLVRTQAEASGEYLVSKQVLPYLAEVDGSIQVGALKNLSMDIERFRLTLAGQPTLDINGHYQQENLNMRLQLLQMPTQILRILGWTHIQIESETGADVQLAGTLAEPKLTGFIELRSPKSELTKKNKGLIQPFRLRADLSSQDGELHSQIHFTYAEQEVGDLHVWLPLAPILQARGPWQERPLDVQAQGTMDLNVSTLFLDPTIHLLQGQLTADFRAQGSLGQPDFSGEMSVEHGTYHNSIYNTQIRDINLVVEGKGESVVIKKAHATSGDNGEVNVTGNLYWSEQRRIAKDAIDLNLTTKNFVLVATNDLYAEVAGTASLSGSVDELWIKGQFEVSPLRTSLDAAIKTPIPSITVREASDASEKNKKTLGTHFPVTHLDIGLSAGRQAFLRGRGLDTELGGKVAISGTAENPEFVGRFETVRGNLEIFGKRFLLKEGEVRFTNKEVSLNIPAVYTTSDLEIRALLSGRLKEPKLTLSSVPDLPQDEVMSRLIFGKSAKSITQYEALRLAAAINTLRSGGGFDPVDSARKILKVDTLTVDNETTETGNGLTLGVGKYINEKVYVELKSSRNPAQPWQGNVQIELSPNVTLETGTSEKSGGNARLMWKRDY